MKSWIVVFAILFGFGVLFGGCGGLGSKELNKQCEPGDPKCSVVGDAGCEANDSCTSPEKQWTLITSGLSTAGHVNQTDTITIFGVLGLSTTVGTTSATSDGRTLRGGFLSTVTLTAP